MITYKVVYHWNRAIELAFEAKDFRAAVKKTKQEGYDITKRCSKCGNYEWLLCNENMNPLNDYLFLIAEEKK